MQFSALLGLALFAPSFAFRIARTNTPDCGALAGLKVGGKDFSRTFQLVCKFYPGEFPVSDVTQAGELIGDVLNPGGVWDKIKQIRGENKDRGFCWRRHTVRSESGECQLGYKRAGLTGLFNRNCITGCMWASHPVACGFGCASTRRQCAAAVVDQSKVVANGVAKAYGFVTGDHRIEQALTAISKLSHFLLDTLPDIVDAVKGAGDIVKKDEFGVKVVVTLIQYLQETAPEVGEDVNSIKKAVSFFADTIVGLVNEKVEKGRIDPRSIVNGVLEHGDAILEYSVSATQVFTNPSCEIKDNVAFTLETVGDERLLGPWVQRGTIEGHPRYTLLGDRTTNMEWNQDKWVIFSDNWSGVLGRQTLYQSEVSSSDYPSDGWTAVHGDEPVPEFVPVEARKE